MKFQFIILALVFSFSLTAQDSNSLVKGSVSFISSQHVYVQFVSTEGLAVGDTLYVERNNTLAPAVIIKDKSTISCVCNALNDIQLSISNTLFFKKKNEPKPLEVVLQESTNAVSVNDVVVETKLQNKEITSKQGVDGRVALSTYLNSTSDSTWNRISRMNLAFNAHHIANSNFSANCYISLTNKNIYRHQYTTIIDTTNVDSPDYKGDSLTQRNVNNITNELRVYDLSVSYDFDSITSLTFGRKINGRLANIGAVDGFQFEKLGRKFSYGAVVGSRPDSYSYSINPNLLQFGAYFGHSYVKKNRSIQTSLAFFNQMNNFITDRRFLYLQHTNSLLKNLDFFGSAEVDLYGKVNNTLGTKFELTSTYLSLRYRPIKKLSLSLNYDARKNVYYYETYKNYVDSILDMETRQGFRFQASYRPLNKLIVGASSGYRLATECYGSSMNSNGYITYTQIPFVDAMLTVDATILKTSYVDGFIYGAALTRDFVNGKLSAELSYRNVDYTFTTSSTLKQNIAELNLSWRIAKKLFLSANFEGTWDDLNNFDKRLFINLTQRF